MNANARRCTPSSARAPQMQPGSSVVAMSSLGSQRVMANYAFVVVSKAALETLVRYLAVELAPQDIRVNAVSAGLVETGALAYFRTVRRCSSGTRAGRRRTLVEPVDVAEVVCFLASPAAGMIRGQTVIVDGGYSLLA